MLSIESKGKLLQVLSQMNAAIRNCGLYAADHPFIVASVDRAFSGLVEILGVTPRLVLFPLEDELIANNEPIKARDEYVSKLIQLFRQRGIEHITFLSGLRAEEFLEFILNLGSPEAGSVRSSSCIRLGKVKLKDGQSRPESAGLASEADSEALSRVIAFRDLKLAQVQEIYQDIRQKQRMDVDHLQEIVKGFIMGFQTEMNPLSLLSSLKSADEYTFTHVVNVGILTIGQAKRLRLDEKHLHPIGIASFLHDVGKLFIPAEILNKSGRLDDKERAIMETHAIKGAQFLLNRDAPKIAVLSALEHHIRYDGTGYPAISGGWRPNFVSQMIAISDVFDAMRSRRAYKEPQPVEAIMGMLAGEKGTTFDPRLVDSFLSMITQPQSPPVNEGQPASRQP